MCDWSVCTKYLLNNIPSIVLVGITGWYAWTTKKMLFHMRQDTAAHVYLRLTLNLRVVSLTLVNTGKSPARNLRVSLANNEVGIKPLRMKSLQEIPFIKDPIGYFPPGERYQYRVGNLDRDFVENNHPIMKFTFNYENGIDSVLEKIEIKLHDYLHIIQRSFLEPADGIVNALRGIQSELQEDGFVKGIHPDMCSKNCPVCHELISEEARKCKHCLEWLPEDSVD